MLGGGRLITLGVLLCGSLRAFCSVWREMNDRSFEDHEKTWEEIKPLFFNRIFEQLLMFLLW